jgi:hypothetical protein
LDFVWQYKLKEHLHMKDLGVRPVLLDDENPRHDCRLYDSTQLNSAMHLKNGPIMDTSKQRGILEGMKKPKTSYIGQQKNLHLAIKQLSDVLNPVVLLHVRGNKYVGKTRFI